MTFQLRSSQSPQLVWEVFSNCIIVYIKLDNYTTLLLHFSTISLFVGLFILCSFAIVEGIQWLIQRLAAMLSPDSQDRSQS